MTDEEFVKELQYHGLTVEEYRKQMKEWEVESYREMENEYRNRDDDFDEDYLRPLS